MKMLLAGTRFPVIALGKPLGSVCGIKGNFSSSGIYHAPGQSYYDTTKRWFCTVQEAVRAGWLAVMR